MEDINWFHVSISFASGGAMGAILNQLFHWWRNRIQPIGKNFEFKPLFLPSQNNTSLNTKVVIENSSNKKFEFDNLWLATLIIANKGNKDFSEFELGIDLADTIQVLQINPTNSNRHHQVILEEEPLLSKPLKELDLRIKPFNRKQLHEFNFLLTSDTEIITDKEITLLSPHPIKFVQIKDFTELVADLPLNNGVDLVMHVLKRGFRF